MRIGFSPVLHGAGGGVYQYSQTLLEAVAAWVDDAENDELVVLAKDPEGAAARIPKKPRVRVERLNPPAPPPPLSRRVQSAVGRVVGEGPHREAWRRLRSRFRRQAAGESRFDPDRVRPRPDIEHWWRSLGIDMVVYPTPSSLSFEVGVPSVVAVHDLQHRLQPEFPEVAADGEWEGREYLFRNIARYAACVLVDSEVGGEDVLSFYGPYGATPERVKVLPFLPACYLRSDVNGDESSRIREKYAVPERYLFYPAQFWPHKNHARIVQALERLRRSESLRIPMVFCGAHSNPIREGHFSLVMNMAEAGGIADQIHYLGYVPDEDMSALYSEAVALVMPTFFGPTNIPVLEAYAFGCPVITSDIRGIREQVGDAGLLVDPKSTEALAVAIKRVWTDKCLCDDLKLRGFARLSTYGPNEFRKRLFVILEEAKERLTTETQRARSFQEFP